MLVAWGARALYVGPPFQLTPHRNAVAVLAVGIDAPFEVALDACDLSRGYRLCRTILIAPNSLHHIQAAHRIAFLYLDAASRDYATLRGHWPAEQTDGTRDHRMADALTWTFGHLADRAMTWPDARDAIVMHLGFQGRPVVDQRIARVADRLRTEPAVSIGAATYASDVGLSVSQFLYLFRDAMGVPFRRYRLWCRIVAAVRAAKGGATLTDAAYASGLSSSAHFSTAFRDMFGLAPSELNIDAMELIDADAALPT